MNIPIILVATLVIAAVFVPIILILFSGNSNKNQLLRKFKQIAAQNQLNIQDFEAWSDKIIGIDQISRKLLYVRENEGNQQVELIDLAELEKCEPVINYKFLKSKNVQERNLEDAGLIFTFKNKAGAQLCFYDQETTTLPNYEEKRVEKWHKTIANKAA